MVATQDIAATAPVQNLAVTVLAQYGTLSGHAFEAAIRYQAAPPGTPFGIATIRELIGVGTHIAARVLRELTAAGLAAAERIKDAATGRILGRRTVWVNPEPTSGAPEQPPEPAHEQAAAVPDRAEAAPDQAEDDADRALALLRSLGSADPRLAFKDRDLRTLVPFVVDRFAAGDTDVDVFGLLTVNLPRKVKSGLLRHRLTKLPKPPEPEHPARPTPGRMVECVQCRAPGPLIPGERCRTCRTEGEPQRIGALPLDRLLPRQLARTEPESAPGQRKYPPQDAF